MTTIAYRDGVIAADTRSTIVDHIVPGETTKLYRLRDKSVVAFAGVSTIGLKMVEWLNEQRGDIPTWKHVKSLVFQVFPDGFSRTYEGDGTWLEQTGPYYAMGSGDEYAYGALAAGASAREAVKIATMFDSASGLPVRTMRVVKGKK